MSTDIATLTTPEDAPDHRSVSTQAMVFDSETILGMQHMAEMLATARVAIPKHLAGSPGDCLAVVMQAAQWQMNPFAVAQKTHLVNGTLGYEAQLVNAVVSSSPLLQTRIAYEWQGDWTGVNGKANKDDHLAVIVSANLRGETLPRSLRMSMAQVGDVRNSPLWVSDPRQQLAYLATKRWARLHAPDVMLGVYTVDELQDAGERAMGQAVVIPEAPAEGTRVEAVKAKLRRLSAPGGAAQPEPGPDLEDVLRAIAAADTLDALSAAAKLAATLTDDAAKASARAAYADRREGIEERLAIQAEADPVAPDECLPATQGGEA